MQLSDARCIPFHTVEATALFPPPRYVPTRSHTGFRFGQVLAHVVSGHFRSRDAITSGMPRQS
jgi:hypothetical protein